MNTHSSGLDRQPREIQKLIVHVADVLTCFTKWDRTPNMALDADTISALHDLKATWKDSYAALNQQSADLAALRTQLEPYLRHKPECAIALHRTGPSSCGFSVLRGGFHHYCWGEFGHRSAHVCGRDKFKVENTFASPCTCGLDTILSGSGETT